MSSAITSVPLEVTRANEWDVRIRWSDGHDAVYPASYLRQCCPCSICQTTAPREDPSVHPLAIDAVGGYAIQLNWSDGHSAGVYTFHYLRAVCPCPECVTA